MVISGDGPIAPEISENAADWLATSISAANSGCFRQNPGRFEEVRPARNGKANPSEPLDAGAPRPGTDTPGTSMPTSAP